MDLETQLLGMRADRNRLFAELQGVRAENAALAAHVEQGKAVVQELLGTDGDPGEDPYLVNARAVRAETWLGQAPETSLARLKAQWQAETADSIATMVDGLLPTGKRSQPDVVTNIRAYGEACRRRQAGADQ